MSGVVDVPRWGLSTLRPSLLLTTGAPAEQVLATAALVLRDRRFSVEATTGAPGLVARRTQWPTLLTLALPGPVVVRVEAAPDESGAVTTVRVTVARGQHELRAERLVRGAVEDLVARVRTAGGHRVEVGSWASSPPR